MARSYWLMKSEPFKYSWDQFVDDGSTYWDGVRNYEARNNLARTLRALDRHEEAAEIYRQAVAATPDDARAHVPAEHVTEATEHLAFRQVVAPGERFSYPLSQSFVVCHSSPLLSGPGRRAARCSACVEGRA